MESVFKGMYMSIYVLTIIASLMISNIILVNVSIADNYPVTAIITWLVWNMFIVHLGGIFLKRTRHSFRRDASHES